MQAGDPTWEEMQRYTPARNAWLKAIRLEDNSEVRWDKSSKAWAVPSISEPALWYLIREIEGSSNRAPWWLRLSCTCPAGQAGRVTCWHRARVALAWTRDAEAL